MQQTPGKDAARELLYRECLPNWLSSLQLRSGHHLVLLGPEPRELPFFKELDVPMSHITSVERDLAVCTAQMGWKTGATIYYGELNDYVEQLLHEQQRYVFMNLDIEGSYIVNTDPAMTSIILFAWLNPESVIATYSTLGRDPRMLMEGVKSLAVFLWMAPEETLRLMRLMAHRYDQCGSERPFNLALRDLFWIRSVLEHTMVAAAHLQLTDRLMVKRFFDIGDILWERVRTCLIKKMTLLQFINTVRGAAQTTSLQNILENYTEPQVGLTIGDLWHVMYKGVPQWRQRCYVSRFHWLPQLMPASAWLRETLNRFTVARFTDISHEGFRRDFEEELEVPGLDKRQPIFEIGPKSRYLTPRRLPFKLNDPRLAASVFALRLRYTRWLEEQKTAPVIVAPSTKLVGLVFPGLIASEMLHDEAGLSDLASFMHLGMPGEVINRLVHAPPSLFEPR